jgi:ABC-type transport system involved in multi-copper enzyme maturation permease subunit
MKFVSETPFLQKLGAGLLGFSGEGELTIKLLVGSTWSHPFIFLLLWGFVAVSLSRFPAQQIEEGSIDLVMSQPVSRAAVLAAQSLVALVSLAVFHGFALAGFLSGSRGLGSDALSAAELTPLLVNLFGTCLFMVGLSTLVSCSTSSRAGTLSAVLAFSLWSLLLSYLKPFVPLAGKLGSLGLLHYYHPGSILQTGSIPSASLAGLTGVGAFLWLAGLFVLKRRDL